MSEIRAGDLVVLIRATPCCGYAEKVGLIFTAGKVRMSRHGILCTACRGLRPDALVVERPDDGSVCERNRLIKIDPLQDPEHIVTDEEITA